MHLTIFYHIENLSALLDNIVSAYILVLPGQETAPPQRYLDEIPYQIPYYTDVARTYSGR